MKTARFQRIVLPCVLAWGIAAALPALAEVQATVSRPTLALGDSFTLDLRATGKSGDATPDLSPLQQDFTIGGTGQSSMTNIVNGKVSRSHGWTITLTPKQTGKLTIPALTVGAEATQPISVEVVDPASLPRAEVQDDGLQVDMSVPDGSYYVQQEIPVTVRITAGAALRSAELGDPTAPDVIVTRTGEDKTRQDTVDGKPVTVVERTYMITPQKSGKLVLPPVTLRGVADDPGARSPGFPDGQVFDQIRRQFGGAGFAGSMFGNVLQPGREVVARSQAITLDIKPRPGAATDWFLPAKNVDLTASWQPEAPTFKVGEAASRVVRIVALGASKEQLPDLDFSDIDGAKVYVDRVDDQSVDTAKGTAAVKQYSVSVVPTRPGTLTLPAISVQWLDTTDGTQKTATIAAETVTVEGTAIAPAPPAPPQAAEPVVSAAAETAAPASPAPILPVGAFGLGAVLVLAVGGWMWLRRRPVPLRAAAKGEAERLAQIAGFAAAARKACRRNDAAQAFARLHAWMTASGINPDALATPAAAGFRAELRTLETGLYGAAAGEGSWQGDRLAAAFDALLRDLGTRGTNPRHIGDLPPLYQ
ncbi:BatD family protein [Tropicimonas sp. IMCC34043]|uniref:BatD family protein n=1 Tax=Tropicimonas sp. IMCC34043 TaxID=2248760 RepID=UPI0013003562|nr:BatD family protein [Tropicimonas sp. IMCC34043]